MSGRVVAAQMMRELEKKYGKVFLENSLHQARFDYAALKRVAAGIDARLPQATEGTT